MTGEPQHPEPVVEVVPMPPGEFPAFVVLVAESAADYAWHQQGTGLPGLADWVVYEVEALTGDVGYDVPGGSPIFPTPDGIFGAADGTTNLAEAQPFAAGTVKWDGCCDFRTFTDHCLHHVCDAHGLEALAAAIARAYALAVEMVGGGV